MSLDPLNPCACLSPLESVRLLVRALVCKAKEPTTKGGLAHRVAKAKEPTNSTATRLSRTPHPLRLLAAKSTAY